MLGQHPRLPGGGPGHAVAAVPHPGRVARRQDRASGSLAGCRADQRPAARAMAARQSSGRQVQAALTERNAIAMRPGIAARPPRRSAWRSWRCDRDYEQAWAPRTAVTRPTRTDMTRKSERVPSGTRNPGRAAGARAARLRGSWPMLSRVPRLTQLAGLVRLRNGWRVGIRRVGRGGEAWQREFGRPSAVESARVDCLECPRRDREVLP